MASFVNTFTKADSVNLPKIDTIMVATFFAANPDFCSAEFRSVKTASPRMVRRKPNDCVLQNSSQESSDDDETVKPRPKAEGRADRFFYETLMCQPKEHVKYGSPESLKFRSPSQARTRAEYSGRKYRDDNDSEYSKELPSKNNESSLADSDVDVSDKKSRRRGKFPFAQVVNFMGKNGKRN